MFVELVDQLRCVRPHEDAWLVAAARRTEQRHIVDGVLGCPVCRAEYPVRDAIADFRGDAENAAPALDEGRGASGAAPSEDELLRAGALLLLADVHAPVVLCGGWGLLAPALATIVPASYLVVDPVAPLPLRHELSALRAAGALPLAAASAHAIALDLAAAADAGLVAGALRALRGAGRLVAPVSLALPPGVRELARDDRHWVAEREPPASAPVALQRPSRR